MSNIQQLITENLDIWANAIKPKKAVGRGRGKNGNGKYELYGIKKLRELILELAVRGLLVPQDPNDEPACELLKKIAAEKEQLVKEKKIKKQKTLSPIRDEEKPFKLPNGWAWGRLKEICLLENGDRSKNYPNKSLLVESGVPFVNAGHLQNGRVNKGDMTFITEERFDLLKAGKFVDGDILFCLRGSLGKSAIVEGFSKGAIASSLVIIRLLGTLNNYYFHNYFDSPFSYRMITLYDNGTAQPNLSAADLGKFLVPMPPLEEQHHIVAKVDELMALCDQLEQQTETSITAHQTLVETVLEALTCPSAANELDASAIFFEHFDTLFTTEHSIDQLKQAILQLAVMGKLVPQDPFAEPASELLKKIAAKKEKLIKEKKIKKQKVQSEIADNEKSFSLPVGWECRRFVDLVDEVATGPFGSMIHKSDYIDGGVPLINPSHMIEGRITCDTSISVSNQKAVELKSYRLFAGDIVMARRGEMGRCALVEDLHENWLCGTGSFVLRFHSEICRAYVLLLFKTDGVRSYLGGNSVGSTMTNLNHGILNKMPILIPPAAEQHRIVAKVNQLMTFCDQLKQHLVDSKTTQLHLADAIAEQAVA